MATKSSRRINNGSSWANPAGQIVVSAIHWFLRRRCCISFSRLRLGDLTRRNEIFRPSAVSLIDRHRPLDQHLAGNRAPGRVDDTEADDAQRQIIRLQHYKKRLML